MSNNQDGNLSFIDALTVFSVILQTIGYQQDRKQTSNDDIIRELQKQERQYLNEILSNQKQILDELSRNNA